MRLAWPAILLFASCSTIRYQAQDVMPVHLGRTVEQNHPVKMQGEKAFYLWGLVPREHVVEIDHELADAGVVNGGNIVIEETQSWSQFFLTLISFGMYIPKSYSIHAIGLKGESL